MLKPSLTCSFLISRRRAEQVSPQKGLMSQEWQRTNTSLTDHLGKLSTQKIRILSEPAALASNCQSHGNYSVLLPDFLDQDLKINNCHWATSHIRKILTYFCFKSCYWIFWVWQQMQKLHIPQITNTWNVWNFPHFNSYDCPFRPETLGEAVSRLPTAPYYSNSFLLSFLNLDVHSVSSLAINLQ